MGKYINREAMLKNLTSDLEHHSDEGEPLTHLIMRRFIKYIEDFPAADVQPVKHGRWYGYLCSECNEYADYFVSGDFYLDEKPNFCPNCGARMDGDKNEAD